ncbi:MAG: CoA transferase, partial [Actinomycetota bacterium]|nr:CoA transferase [Actinomycetota bacterium]
MSGPELAAETCARRLAPLGISTLPAAGDGPAGSDQEVGIAVDGKRQAGLELWLSWYGPAGPTREQDGSEAVLQAVTGLMQVHGRDAGMPRRLGLEAASVAAGILAAQGVLAALVGRSRGRPTSAVRTSVLQAALVLVSHSVAAATTGDEWVPAPPAPAPGPPFATADGHWLEMETLDPEAWKRFWQRLGAGDADLGWAWTLFRSRYYRGTCTLPPGLHEATASHSLAAITRVADDCDVSLCPLRSYQDVLDDPGRWEGHAAVRLLAGAAVT